MSDWALCVGIGTYTASSKLVALPGALNDARAIHDWIIDPHGGAVPKLQAKLILSPATQNEDDPNPPAQSIEGFLRARFRDAEASRQRGDGFIAGRRLWLYFSGHGIGFPDDDNDTGLLAADALPPLRDLPHVAGKAWAELFRVTRAFEEVVLFMDCCRLETNRTALRKPAVQSLLANPQGKMMAAFAVSPSKAAHETNSTVHGVPRGKFTVELEKLLVNPPKTPMTAREFLEQLELRTPDFDPFPPRSAKADFEFLPARQAAAPSANAPLLIVHGESTRDLASSLAEALETPVRSAQIRWAGNVLAESNADAFASVRELVVTRDVNSQELRDLVNRVQPRRTVLFSQKDPGVSDLPGFRFVRRPDAAMLNLSEQAIRVAAALEEAPGFLTVSAEEPLAKIRVWNEHGSSTASGFGSLERLEVPPGMYQIRAALGSHHVETTTEVSSGETNMIALPALSFRLPSVESLLNWKAIETGARGNRPVYEGWIGGSPLFFSAPRIAHWRLEAFSHFPDHAVDFSVRLVPDSHPPGAPHKMDSTRESLKLALTERSWDASTLTVEAVASDPVCALLAAALRLKCGQPHEDFTDCAAAMLGDDDADVQLLRGTATIEDSPLLSFLWHFRLKRNELNVTPDSPADRIVGRLQLTEPWLTWTVDSKASKRSWLGEVANATWPGWDEEPDVELALSSIADGANSLGAPAESLKRRTYKAPPIDRLVQHQEIAFVGASNDQLPAALAVAFVERGRKKWKRLDVWSLTDDRLKQVQSDDRTPDSLVAARNRAERQLQQLLKVVADDWSVRRYSGFEIPYGTEAATTELVWCFASLWDWLEKGGYVHVSPYRSDENVRTGDFEDLIWSKEEPPPVYRSVALAYQELRPVEVVCASQPQ